jgi:hypothetical protein
MGQLNSLVIAVGLSIILMGCRSSTQASKVGKDPYGKVELGMSLDEAKAMVDGEGEERSYENLPAAPKPREIYSKLPTDTKWLVWAAVGKPSLIVGVVGGKIAFKQVLRNVGGEIKSDTSALPEYQ